MQLHIYYICIYIYIYMYIYICIYMYLRLSTYININKNTMLPCHSCYSSKISRKKSWFIFFLIITKTHTDNQLYCNLWLNLIHSWVEKQMFNAEGWFSISIISSYFISDRSSSDSATESWTFENSFETFSRTCTWA